MSKILKSYPTMPVYDPYPSVAVYLGSLVVHSSDLNALAFIPTDYIAGASTTCKTRLGFPFTGTIDKDHPYYQFQTDPLSLNNSSGHAYDAMYVNMDSSSPDDLKGLALAENTRTGPGGSCKDYWASGTTPLNDRISIAFDANTCAALGDIFYVYIGYSEYVQSWLKYRHHNAGICASGVEIVPSNTLLTRTPYNSVVTTKYTGNSNIVFSL